MSYVVLQRSKLRIKLFASPSFGSIPYLSHSNRIKESLKEEIISKDES